MLSELALGLNMREQSLSDQAALQKKLDQIQYN